MHVRHVSPDITVRRWVGLSKIEFFALSGITALVVLRVLKDVHKVTEI